MLSITTKDIENLLGFQVTNQCKELIENFSLQYHSLSDGERDQAVIECIDKLLSNVSQVGSHRQEVWENGWNENLQNFILTKEYEDLIPKYFEKQSAIDCVARWNNNFIKTKTENFIYKIFTLFVDCIITKFINEEFDNIYEFGCGTGYNLVRFSKYYEKMSFIGLDWAKSSQEIIRFISEQNIVKNIDSHNFNYFDIDSKYEIKPNSAVITCCSLEQIGDSFKDVVDYWVSKKPKLCINFENENSIFDDSSLLDKLSIEYAKKRKYLDGFYSYLKELESKNLIQIIYQKRLYSGNIFHEAYPVFVWKVL